MKSLQGLSLRLFRANKFIVFSSIFSIAIATMLVLSMILFSFNAQDTLKHELKQAYGDMDLSVGFDLNQDNIISPSLINKISQNKKVKQLSKVTVTHVDLNKTNSSIYTVGVENNHLAKSRYHFTKSLDENSIVINKGLAQALHAEIGDQVFIQDNPFTLVEVIDDLTATGVAPDMIIMEQQVAKEYAKINDGISAEATYLLVIAKEGTNLLTLSNQIKSYDNDLRIDITEQDPTVQNNLQSLRTFVIVLSVLVLMVTSLLIISNFELLLYKMKNQMAIMRSLGATTKQMSKMILIQSVIINFLGICIGFLLAFLSQTFIYSWMEKLFHLSSSPTNFNLKVAIIISLFSFIVIQLFLLVPSYRSAKILPLKIMEQNEKLGFGYSKARVVIFKILVGISLFLIIASQVLPTREQYGIFMLLIAAMFILLAFFLILPVWLPKLLEWLLPYGQKIFGQEYYVAIKNLIPQVRKNTVIILTISALMIIAVFGSVMLKTIETTQQEYLKSDFPTPIVVDTRLGYNTELNPKELTTIVEKLPDVQQVSNFSTLGLGELQNNKGFTDFDYALVDLERLQKQNLIPHLKVKNLDNSLVVSKEFAKQNNLRSGQTIQLGLYSDEKQRIEIKGTYIVEAVSDQLLNGADAYMDWNNKDFKGEKFYRLYISSKHVKDAVKQLEGLKNQFPEIKISSYEQSVKEATKMFYQRWGIFIAVIAILVMTTMVGVFNSLANNIYSKRKEYAVLRTMGVKPKGIRKVILTQVTTYIIIGLFIGIIMGLALTYILLLVDPGNFTIDYKVITSIILVMLIFSTILFTYLGNKIASQNISLEITSDNK
ncbi:FtsX-like permease family protein [Priestia filamentosa]|uniref:FtsX-like permease family protein n=1 Tax=Priestia filamentosa TaxID=1402861 RepID=UPI003981D1EB